MAFMFSLGLRKHQIYDGSVLGALDDCFITLYSGIAPLSPSDALTPDNKKLCVISGGLEGTVEPLAFQAYSPSSPTSLLKDTSQAWQGDVLESGTVNFFRIEKSGDTGELDESAIRIQGTVGGPSDDMTISNPELVEGSLQRLEYFAMTLVEYA